MFLTASTTPENNLNSPGQYAFRLNLREWAEYPSCSRPITLPGLNVHPRSSLQASPVNHPAPLQYLQALPLRFLPLLPTLKTNKKKKFRDRSFLVPNKLFKSLVSTPLSEIGFSGRLPDGIWDARCCLGINLCDNQDWKQSGQGPRRPAESQIAMASPPGANQIGLNQPGLSNPNPAQSICGAAQKKGLPCRSSQLVTVTLPLCLPHSPCFFFLSGTWEIHLLSPLPSHASPPLPVPPSKSNGYSVILPFPETLLHSLMLIHSL